MARALTCLFGITLLLAAHSWAQDSDQHLTMDPAGPLCQRSAYVHGYIHGYENGYRVGDLDIHLGRKPRAVSEVKEYRQTSGYRSGFGNRSYFRLGYQQGFRAAYEDVFRNIPFRGINQLRQAAEGTEAAGSRRDFDQAVSAGYDAGYTSALNSPRRVASFQHATEHCLASHGGAYCDAYARGYRLGYTDGYVTQASRLTHTARAGANRQD